MTSNIKLVGIGSCGANIIKKFNYEGYDALYVDNEEHADLSGLQLGAYPDNTEIPHHELYDTDKLSWASVLKENEEVQIFLSGASDISGVILQLLQYAHEQKCRTTVFYIKPERKFLSNLQKLQDKVTYGILQEYARSALFENLIIIDNAVMGQLIGKTSISNYYSNINAKIAELVHTYNFCTKNKPIFGQKNNFLEITRIGTLGLGILTEDINLLYDLKSTDGETIFPLEIQYYFLVPREKVDNDENLMEVLLETVEKEETKYKSISYGVYEISSEQEEVSVLVYLRTSQIQAV